MSLRIRALQRTQRFEREFKRLDPQTQKLVARCLQGLLEHPIPARLRHPTLGGNRPAIHVIDVSGNHAWQVTFRCEGDVATLLRVATHVPIDRDPGVWLPPPSARCPTADPRRRWRAAAAAEGAFS